MPPKFIVTHSKVAAIAIALTLIEPVFAKCTLPVPDGGESSPSPENLHGRIVSVANDIVTIRQEKTGRSVAVQIPKNPEIYSAFGGDVAASELAPGQTVWVWFSGCKWPRTGNPVSAFFQVYSRDPADQPK